jgi:hypothetical protein
MINFVLGSMAQRIGFRVFARLIVKVMYLHPSNEGYQPNRTH